MKRTVKITERGWASHFCCSDRCQFHRSTLLECGKTALVVSSVGRLWKEGEKDFIQIGLDRYFETMVFYAKDDKFRDADVSKEELYLDYPDTNTPDDEIGANDIHEKTVRMFVEKLENGDILSKE